MQYGMLHPMGKVFYLSQLAADQKELVSDKICDITLHTNEKPRVEDAYGRVVQTDFDENRPTSSMVFDVIMGASGWIIARNERIGIVAFQNI